MHIFRLEISKIFERKFEVTIFKLLKNKNVSIYSGIIIEYFKGIENMVNDKRISV